MFSNLNKEVKENKTKPRLKDHNPKLHNKNQEILNHRINQEDYLSETGYKHNNKTNTRNN